MELDQTDWNKTVEDIGPRLYRYFCARFQDEEASDLTQESLIRLVRKVRAGEFDPQRGTLVMYSFGIAHFVALESQARLNLSCERGAAQLQETEEQPPSVESDLVTRQELARLRNALSLLEPSEQDVMSLMIEEDLSLPAIAKILDMPVGTVKSHVHRAKLKLVQLLQRRGHEKR